MMRFLTGLAALAAGLLLWRAGEEGAGLYADLAALSLESPAPALQRFDGDEIALAGSALSEMYFEGRLYATGDYSIFLPEEAGEEGQDSSAATEPRGRGEEGAWLVLHDPAAMSEDYALLLFFPGEARQLLAEEMQAARDEGRDLRFMGFYDPLITDLSSVMLEGAEDLPFDYFSELIPYPRGREVTLGAARADWLAQEAGWRQASLAGLVVALLAGLWLCRCLVSAGRRERGPEISGDRSFEKSAIRRRPPGLAGWLW